MATNQVSEQEIQFRKRARRRLVGAIALVLLMVTVLPMVLDDREVKPTQQDIAITIPSQDGTSFSSRIVPVSPDAPGQPSAADTAPSKLQPLASPLEKPAAAAVKPEPQPVTENPQPVVKPEPVKAAPAKAETAAIAKSEEPKQKTVAKAETSKPTPVKKGAFMVQIGVFTEGEPLKKLEAKLAAQGVKVAREKLNTPKGTKIRLRTGPFATRADAEAMQAKLKAAGMGAMVVANK